MKATSLVSFCTNQLMRKTGCAFMASAWSVPREAAEEQRRSYELQPPRARMLPAATFSLRVAKVGPRRWQHTDWIKKSAPGLQNLHNVYIFFFFKHLSLETICHLSNWTYTEDSWAFWLALRMYQGLTKGEREEMVVQPIISGWFSLLLRNEALGKLLSRAGQGVTSLSFLTHGAFILSVFIMQTQAETLH